MTFKASLFSVLTMGNENQIPLVQFSLMYKLISMSVWNIQLRENRHVAWPSALESWSDALFILGQIFWWLCMWYNKWQHPLFPLNPCSDTNSVAYCGIKGKFFSGPLFPHFEQKGHINKAEHWRINAFGLWCWRRLLRLPWTARRSSQSILKEISSEYSLEGLMLELKLPILWPPHTKNWLWCWERLKAGGKGDDRGWDHWMASPSQWTWIWASSGRWWRTGSLVFCSPWGHKESEMT